MWGEEGGRIFLVEVKIKSIHIMWRSLAQLDGLVHSMCFQDVDAISKFAWYVCFKSSNFKALP